MADLNQAVDTARSARCQKGLRGSSWDFGRWQGPPLVFSVWQLPLIYIGSGAPDTLSGASRGYQRCIADIYRLWKWWPGRWQDMPSGSDGAAGAEVSETGGTVSSQLAFLVPSFDPSKDDLQLYQQKVQLVFAVWPSNKVSELITRLILGTTGTAFSKLQLHYQELCVNDEKGVQRLIELLGGHWGKTGLEKRYSDAEKALFQCQQLSDESHDSFLARADVLWTKLMSQKLSLEDLQAYVTLRGSLLSVEDKKRVIIDSDNSLEGKLTMVKVRESVRMLGTSFFQEMTGVKKGTKSKVYDQSTLTVEDVKQSGDYEDQAHLAGHDDAAVDDFIESLAQEGDEDAVFVADFETAATDVVQGDGDLAAAFSTYLEARRKLSEKYRARGFWPISKGKFKGSKGKSKGKPSWNNRKTLQQRILESNCRICGRKGHWKSECPNRGQPTNSSSTSTAPVTLSLGVASTAAPDAMSAEFLSLPEVAPSEQDHDGTRQFCFVQSSFFCIANGREVHRDPTNMREVRERIRNRIEGNRGTNSKVASLVSRIENRLLPSHDQPAVNRKASVYRKPFPQAKCSDLPRSHSVSRSILDQRNAPRLNEPKSPMPGVSNASAEVLFATHDTWGILDTGATKTVMGSEFVSSFLKSVHASVRSKIRRCPCDVTFRFGNQGTLKSVHAMVVPMCGYELKIAVVPGATPFLVSNTLLRALGAMIDTSANQLILPRYNQQIPLKLSNKGLYLVDMNMLFQVSPHQEVVEQPAETFAQESIEKKVEVCPSEVESVMMESNNKIMNGRDEKKSVVKKSKTDAHDMSTPTTCNAKFTTCQSHEPVSTNHDVSSSNVIHLNDPRTTEQSEAQASVPNDHPARSPPDHERVDQTSPEAPGRDADSRDRNGRPPEPGNPAERESEVRKGPSGQDLCRVVGDGSGVDPMVLGPLPRQLECRAQEGDQIHQVEDRRRREPGRWSSTTTCASEAQSCSEVIDSNSPLRPSTAPRCSTRGASISLRGELPGGSHDEPRERSPPDPCASDTNHRDHCRPGNDERRSSGAPSGIRVGRSMECLGSEPGDRHWALTAGEIDEFTNSQSNAERNHFNKLVSMMELELARSERNVKIMGPKANLIEVFCSDQSTLTEQVNQLGGKALRFGLSQGDLQQPEGRKKLFDAVCRHRPEHVWVSPTCKPWSKWSCRNSQKSLEMWDRIHAERRDMLSQVALCLVLCRYQHRCNRHAHWEQPGGSIMFMLPYLNELGRYMLSAKPDMCNAGSLQDPVTCQPIKKGMHILTTSRKMHDILDPLRCQRDHSHQVIEGSTRVHGQGVARSVFTERYPRKFARLIAKTILKRQFPTERPVGTIVDPALFALDQGFQISSALAVDARMPKQVKLSGLRQRKAKSADRSLEPPPTEKRRRFKQPECQEQKSESSASVPEVCDSRLGESCKT